MSDLVKRLRTRKTVHYGYKQSAEVLINPYGEEAADRIEQLEAQLSAADELAEQVTMAHGFTYEYGHRSLAEALTTYREARK